MESYPIYRKILIPEMEEGSYPHPNCILTNSDTTRSYRSRLRRSCARPRDAPRGAVSAFCAECGISRNTFYKLRRRAVDEGEAAVLEPRSRRPASSPTRIGDERVAQALRVRAALASWGLDAGPVSVCDKMACSFVCVSSLIWKDRYVMTDDVVARVGGRGCGGAVAFLWGIVRLVRADRFGRGR